jgi:hypothetical protein
MAAWLPAIKVILPYLTQIVTAAIPAFTKKPSEDSSQEVVANQITELQNAVIHNAESMKTLATQLQQVINGLESGAAKAEKEVRTIKKLLILAIIIAGIAIVFCLITWLQ